MAETASDFLIKRITEWGLKRVTAIPVMESMESSVRSTALEVLENAGFHVVVLHVDLCCGRPLYDYGMLDTAKRWLGQISQNIA